MHVNQQLYIQTVMSYQTIDGESKMRVTTITRRWLESSAITEELVQGFDQVTAGRSQVVVWPPVRNYRKNNIQAKKAECESGIDKAAEDWYVGTLPEVDCSGSRHGHRSGRGHYDSGTQRRSVRSMEKEGYNERDHSITCLFKGVEKVINVVPVIVGPKE
ncbi:sec23/Sec24 protein transport family protein [Artemisia annua]|uniref:Auxin-responsive protein n=1 Tax=Artemisia annua TaxID=35608 RepID=A0A2U1MMD5_ARTAN|nr:sec23/Sec24 protein transport family protein [Artemisia annua]